MNIKVPSWKIALLSRAGYSVKEIAKELGVSRSLIDNRVGLSRSRFKFYPYKRKGTKKCRHEEMAKMAIEGKTNYEIAKALGYSPSTISSILSSKCRMIAERKTIWKEKPVKEEDYK